MSGRLLQIVALMATALGVSACSLVIDVDPNCAEVANCSPYVCNDENTACLAGCVEDRDCAEGFVCEVGGGECISQGCVATAEPKGLFSLSGTGFEYDVARLGERFFVLAASDEGVGLVELTQDGELVGGDNAFVVLDNAPAPPVHPNATANDDGVAFFWRGEVDTNVFDLRTFHVGADGTLSGPRVVYEGRRDQSIENPDAAYSGDDLLLVWSTFVGRVQVELLVLNANASYGPDELDRAPNDATSIVTDENTGSALPAVTATAERPVVGRRETVSGSNGVTVSFLDSTFRPINDHDVSGSPGLDIRNIQVAGMATAVAVAWIESVDGTPTLMRAVDNDNGTVLSGTPSQGFSMDLRDAALAAGSTEFALAWVGDELDGLTGRDVLMRRFDSTGQLLFVTFSASGRRASDPAQPRLVRTPDGYAVFWVEQSGTSPELTYRRFVCAR